MQSQIVIGVSDAELPDIPFLGTRAVRAASDRREIGEQFVQKFIEWTRTFENVEVLHGAEHYTDDIPGFSFHNDVWGGSMNTVKNRDGETRYVIVRGRLSDDDRRKLALAAWRYGMSVAPYGSGFTFVPSTASGAF